MLFMNEFEVDRAVDQYVVGSDDFPNLSAAVQTLDNLVNWTNCNSDGWPYWSAPCKAAKNLQALITGVDRFDPKDVTAAEVRKALSPVKAFRTKRGADFVVVSP